MNSSIVHEEDHIELDLSSPPKVPSGFSLQSHDEQGRVRLTISKLKVVSPDDVGLNIGNSWNVGDFLRSVNGEKIINANFIDAVIMNRHPLKSEFEKFEFLCTGTKFEGGWVRSLYFKSFADYWDWAAVRLNKPLKPNHRIILL